MAARRKKSRPRSYRTSHSRWRVAVVAVWCALIAVLLFFVGKRIAAGVGAEGSTAAPDTLLHVAMPQGARVQVLRYSAFTVYYDSARHVPRCVAYELTAEHAAAANERVGSFEADSTARGCASPDDYTATGYQRGHMAPAADMGWSERAMAESFLMTNICPQRKRLNEGGWKRLEAKVREWAERDGRLLVFTGPVLTSRDATIARRRVAVPGRYYKVVMAPDARPRRAVAFVYPNASAAEPLESYAVSVDEVERLTGLDFFTALPEREQRELERAPHLAAFNF